MITSEITMAVAIWARLEKIAKFVLQKKKTFFHQKFAVVFHAMQVSKHTIDLIDHHFYSVKFYLLFISTPKEKRPKVTELLGYY